MYFDYGYMFNFDLKGFNNDYLFLFELCIESEFVGKEIVMF